MKAIRTFDEFIKNNTVKRQGIDKSRANFLVKRTLINSIFSL